jgi:hypothetical protein
LNRRLFIARLGLPDNPVTMETNTRGFTAVMAQRREPPDALDFFPTPLWGSRALFRHVLPFLGIEAIGSAWEPACGEGHMAAVIREFTDQVTASDIFDYGFGKALPDFLNESGPDHHQPAVQDCLRVHVAGA